MLNDKIEDLNVYYKHFSSTLQVEPIVQSSQIPPALVKCVTSQVTTVNSKEPRIKSSNKNLAASTSRYFLQFLCFLQFSYNLIIKSSITLMGS